MEGERFFQDVRGLAVMAGYAGPFKVILQQGLVFGVGNLVDDDGCSFFRGQAAQVGNAPFGNDNVHIVFGAVDMGAEGNHGADLAALSLIHI